jgi:hypothetical protein
MSFRRPRRTRHAAERSRQGWLASHEPLLRAAGLPPQWTVRRRHWEYFLEHGYVDSEPADWRAWFGDLPPDQMRALLDLIESSEYAHWTMASWLRVRLRPAQTP